MMESGDLTKKQAILSGIPYVVTKQFPWKLHEMLEQTEKKGMDHIVSWMPSGKSFKVHKQDEFSDVIMNVYFQQTKFKSFQRQCKWLDAVLPPPPAVEASPALRYDGSDTQFCFSSESLGVSSN